MVQLALTASEELFLRSLIRKEQDRQTEQSKDYCGICTSQYVPLNDVACYSILSKLDQNSKAILQPLPFISDEEWNDMLNIVYSVVERIDEYM